jgi:uncharacterized membrane protein
MQRSSIRTLTLSGLLGAVAIVLGATPLGLIPVPSPGVQYATIMHIPAIIGGVAGGPIVGIAVGLIFGLFSLTRASALPPDPLVAVLPRLLIGVVAVLVYRALQRWGQAPALAGAAVAGTLTNTVGFLGMAVARGYLAGPVAWTVGVTHGIPEMIVAALITVPVGLGLQRAGLFEAPRRAG